VTFSPTTPLRTLVRLKKEGVVGNHTYAVVAVDKRAGTLTLANPKGPAAKAVTVTDKDLRDSVSRVVDAPTR
jgi:hypothetical protein